MDFVEASEARTRSGLHLVVVAGLPSPWGEAAKGILRVDQVPFVAVRMNPGDTAVHEWTGQTSAPVACYEDEPPRGGWAEILILAERLADKPRLVPEDAAQRAELFGFAHEICGEMGLGWCRRLCGVQDAFDSDGKAGFPLPVAKYLADRYGHRPGCGPQVRGRVLELLGMLASRLESQRAAGSRYYLGDRISALDIYSAAFMVLFKPLPPEQCPMPDAIRWGFEAMDDATRAALHPILLEHRDFIYGEYLELPIQL